MERGGSDREVRTAPWHLKARLGGSKLLIVAVHGRPNEEIRKEEARERKEKKE